jgi:hypothetical protein
LNVPSADAGADGTFTETVTPLGFGAAVNRIVTFARSAGGCRTDPSNAIRPEMVMPGWRRSAMSD